MGSFIKRLKLAIQNTWYSFEDAVNANRKKSLFYVVATLLLVSLLTVFMLFINSKIRTNQIDYLVYNNLPDQKIIPTQYNEIDQVIQDKKAISVMFATADSSDLTEVLAMVSAKEEELNRRVYYYPVVYNSEEASKKYSLADDQVTFIFFQSGIEKNRFTYSSIKNPQKNFIPELNRLPMWNIKSSEN